MAWARMLRILCYPATLMPDSRINRPHRSRQPGTAVGENQTERSAFQSASVEILQQGFPVRLTFALTAQKSQQVTAAIAPDPVRHQHLDQIGRASCRERV